MSLQVFLQAQLLGTEEFLTTPSPGVQAKGVQHASADLFGRCAWLTLFCEVLPRALLSELKLSRMLRGSSSAEQFLLVLAEEDIPRADEFLSRAAEAVAGLSSHTLRLVWSSTENLGAWPVARKRLDDALLSKTSAPAANTANIQQLFAPFSDPTSPGPETYFSSFAESLPVAANIGWSPQHPARLVWDSGQYTWPLKEDSGEDDDRVPFPRRFAMDDNGALPVSLPSLAQRAEGAPCWGILRGDVDQFDPQLRRLGSVEEHIHMSVLFKEFFAGELALLCTMPGFWRKTSVLYRGGDDFAVLGTWDALIPLAREIERLFEQFMEQNLQGLPSLEGKTISMALALAPDSEALPSVIFKEAGAQLRAVKATEPGSLSLFGRTLDWKRLTDAEELKSNLVRLVRDFNYASGYISDLSAVYRESLAASNSRRNKPIRIEKPWRTYMRLATVIPQGRSKEVNNLRTAVITNLIGKRTAGLKLRPSARVALDWARFAVGE